MKLVANIPEFPVIEMPNTLINASYHMPISAMRLQMIAFTKLNLSHYINDKPIKIKILAEEYIKYFGTDKKNIYKVLKHSAEHMLKTKVLFNGADDKVNILDKYDYLKGGTLVLHYNQKFLRRCLMPIDNPLSVFFGL
jgi:hypothetical protein